MQCSGCDDVLSCVFRSYIEMDVKVLYQVGDLDAPPLTLLLDKSHLAACQVLPGNDEALDLGGSFINLVNLGITHQLLNGVLGVETIASKHLLENQ